MISGIILAAGESRRMGKAGGDAVMKQTLKIGESTILERVIDVLYGSTLEDVIVVLGHRADEIREKILSKVEHRLRPVRIAVNERYKDGMLSSIQCGLRALSDETRAFLIALGDQPFISGNLVNEIVEGYKRSGRGIAIPTYRGSRGHPLVLDIKYKEEVLSTSVKLGMRQVITKHAHDVLEVKIDSEDILKDIDTPEDYRRELKELESQGT